MQDFKTRERDLGLRRRIVKITIAFMCRIADIALYIYIYVHLFKLASIL